MTASRPNAAKEHRSERESTADRRRRVEQRILRAAIHTLTAQRTLDRDDIAELWQGAGITEPAFRTLYPTDRALLSAVRKQLMDDCIARLEYLASRMDEGGAVDLDIDRLSTLIVRSAPTDYAAVTASLVSRLDELRYPTLANAPDGIRGQLASRVAPWLVRALSLCRRELLIDPEIAVAAIAAVYEREFEAWISNGQSERAFIDSSFCTLTLPTLLIGLSRTQ